MKGAAQVLRDFVLIFVLALAIEIGFQQFVWGWERSVFDLIIEAGLFAVAFAAVFAFKRGRAA